MEMKEPLWRKLNIQVKIPQNNHHLNPRWISSNNLSPYKIQDLHSNDDKQLSIYSPTFKKLRLTKFQSNQQSNQNFSFCGHMIQQISNLLLQAYDNQQKKCMSFISQQVDTFSSTQQPKNMFKTTFNEVITKIINFVTQVRHMIDQIKFNIKNYQQFYSQHKIYLQNHIFFIINQINNKYQQEIYQLQSYIQSIKHDNYYTIQKFKIMEKKQSAFKQQIQQLINQINKEKLINQKLNKKLLQLTNQFQVKMKQNSQLLSQKYRLKSSIQKLVQITNNYQKNIKQHHLNLKNYQQNHQQNDETPQKQSTTQFDNNKYNFIVSAKTTIPPNTHKDFLSDFTQSITFCQQKSDDIFMNNGKHLLLTNITQQLKQNQKISANYSNNTALKCSINKKTIVGTTPPHENQPKLKKKNPSTLSGPLKTLTNDHYYKQKILMTDDKNNIIDRIKKLKKQICLQIQDLRMDNN